MENYRPRIVDSLLTLRLKCMGAVLIEGPKWCGKTTTAEQQAASVIRLQDPDRRMQYEAAIKSKPSILLKGDTPRLVDEWQIYPVLWDSVRTVVDQRGLPGQFILTGSNSVDRSQIMHSGTGRITHLKMLPMSLYESGESNGAVSLKQLFDNPDVDFDGETSDLSVEDIVFAACRGGWPASLNFTDREAQLFTAKSYVDSVCNMDAGSVDGVRRDPLLVRRILQSYSRNVSTLAKKSVIYSDVNGSIGCSVNTLTDYLYVLQRLFVIEDLPAWSPSIRSASSMRAGVKRQLVDPSIAVASLGLSYEALMQDLNTFGFIFETLCCRDLKSYSAGLGGSLSYYHDRYGLEADAVLHIDDGRYALVEFKLGSAGVDEGAKHLLEIKRLVDKAGIQKPSFMMVLTGGELCYRRNDGVYVVSVGCLKD